MTKALMLSVIAATVVIPVVASRAKRPGTAFRVLFWSFAVFCAAYLMVILFGTPHVSMGD